MIKFDDSITEQEAVAVVKEFVWNDDKSADFLDYVNNKKIVSVIFSFQWPDDKEEFMYSFLKKFGIPVRVKHCSSGASGEWIDDVLCYTIGDWLYFMRANEETTSCKYRVPWDYVEFDDEGAMIFHEKGLD